jgi:cytochrome P450
MSSILPESSNTTLPENVPQSLVGSYPFHFGTVTDRDPFGDLAAQVHRDSPPVFWSSDAYPGGRPSWIVRRAEDLRRVFSDPEHFSTRGFAPFPKLVGGSWNILPIESDPPLHSHYRAVINPWFTPKAMAKLEEYIRNYAVEYINRFRDHGSCEFMSEFAFEFPIKVFIELMGLPQDLTQTFLAWEKDLLHTGDLATMAAATNNVVDYLKREIDARHRAPKDDLLSHATQAKVDGRGLTADEQVGFAFNLFIGGLDTVSTNMGLHFLHLARNPDQQARLRAHPEEVPEAIEELMRAYPAVTVFRVCVKETSLNGARIVPGDMVAVNTTLVGRDPEEYADPEQVTLDRNAKHLSFGFGPHLCIGMHLARREMRIAMEEFLGRIPEFSLPEEHALRWHLGGMVQPVEVPLTW